MSDPDRNIDDLPDDSTALEVLGADTSRVLLREASVGRLAFVVDGRPMVLPVNYMLDGDSILLCSGPGTKLDAVTEGAEVAFEVDEVRALHHAGWSVVTRGRAGLVTDPAELARLEHSPLRSWARGARANWIRIPIEEISGRRLPGA